MSKKVFIYARRSNLKNKEDSISIDLQIQEIQKVCIEKWLEVDTIFKDNQSSFTAWKRNDFNKMIDELQKRNIKLKWDRIDYIYVYMASRLARNMDEANIIWNLIEKEEIQILSIDETYEEWLKWQKQLRIDLLNAEYSSKEKSEKGKKNMDTTQKKKGRLSRRPPFWYKMEIDEFWTKKMVINNDNNESKIVKIVYEYYSTWNYTYKSLAEYLTDNWYQKVKINKAAKKKSYINFTVSNIANILIKPIYYWKVISKFTKLTNAEIKYFEEEYWDIIIGKEIIVDYTNFIKEIWDFKTLISWDLYNKCLEIRQWKKWKTKKIEDASKWPIYLFRGLLRCPCKSNIESEINNYFRYTQEEKPNNKWTGKNNYYKCSGWNKSCINKSVSELKFENQIIEDFIDWIVFWDEEISIFKEIIYFQLKNLWEIKENAWKLLNIKLINLKKNKNKYYELYIDEDDDDFKIEHKKKYKEIKDEIEWVENQLENIPAIVKNKEEYIKDYIYYINELWANFRSFPKIRRSKILKSFFEYIILDKISTTKFNVVDFKLNPIFELAYNKKKVRCNVKNWNNSNNTTSNFENGLSNSKISNSNNFVLNGSSTRNRT